MVSWRLCHTKSRLFWQQKGDKHDFTGHNVTQCKHSNTFSNTCPLLPTAPSVVPSLTSCSSVVSLFSSIILLTANQPVSTFHWVINPTQDHITWSQADYSFPGKSGMCSAQLNTTSARPIHLRPYAYTAKASHSAITPPPREVFSCLPRYNSKSDMVDRGELLRRGCFFMSSSISQGALCCYCWTNTFYDEKKY